MDGEILLRQRVDEVGCTQVAIELTAICDKKISRTAVSLTINRKYPGDPKHIYRRAEECYGKLDCPFLAQRISRADCHQYSHRPMPEPEGDDTEAMEKVKTEIRHWRACKSCDLKR